MGRDRDALTPGVIVIDHESFTARNPRPIPLIPQTLSPHPRMDETPPPPLPKSFRGPTLNPKP